jgi:DNA-binding response OmpR family regulator
MKLGRFVARPRVARTLRPPDAIVNAHRPTVLICDEDRVHTDALAAGLAELGYSVEVTRTHAEAFAIACAFELDALVAAPFLRDGSALVLPAALGIRRPGALVLACRMTERLAPMVLGKAGFDAQLVKVVDARTVDRMVRAASRRRHVDAR